MRISDWSSDVCSSDLQKLTAAGRALLLRAEDMERCASAIGEEGREGVPSGILRVSASEGFGTWIIARHLHRFSAQYPNVVVDLTASSGFLNPTRSEEHTSELQSLMRISYAVFCLKKKTNQLTN